MSALPVIAVFDIGKTNKKCFLFDDHYRIVYESSAVIPETADEDGDTCEDLPALRQWVRGSFDAISGNPAFRIRALNASAYGASFVHLSADGEPLTPLYNYLKPYPENIQGAFYKKYDGEERFSLATASPVLGSLNAGLQLYRLKQERPELFGCIRYSLHLPQYITWLFSGVACSDITSIGCHTALWDFQRRDYHVWVGQEGLIPKLAPIRQHGSVNTVRGAHDICVGLGVHDSSSALIPYLSMFPEPFLLISTGTWCISLNPFNDTPLTPAELKMDCLSYMAYDGRTVKASRLFAGYEHEQQVKKLAAHFLVHTDAYRSIEFDPAWPDAAAGKPYTPDDLSAFGNYAEAYHALVQSIIDRQCRSSLLVMGSVKRIFVDGGFANNTVFMQMLAEAFPQHEVFGASVSQATAMGAALLMHDHWNSRSIPGDLVSLKYYTAKHR